MSIKFQYNKISQQRLQKQLDIRLRALPTLQSKEAALRVEVKKAKDTMKELDKKLQEKLDQYEDMARLWCEFDKDLVTIREVKLATKKIAGTKTPVLEDVDFDLKDFSMYNNPSWYLKGVDLLESLGQIAVEKEVFRKKMELLDYARKKTTQKVNLYEKVQIPEYLDAINKIKRFLEDQENLSKAAQKIVKKRHEQQNQ
ncbi:MAG: V-type ATP synthase subunit D [Bacteroidales bacterium]|nr:V-type ATP synthase subunit D [Bacteroidales bacterium]MBS3775145.1 V-type ATP synthase subunit D [Bacteroidales bacterium]